MHTSPESPRRTGRLVPASTTLTSTCGPARPTVDTRRFSGSSNRVCVATGEVSVMP